MHASTSNTKLSMQALKQQLSEGALSRLMPNVGGPKPRRRALLASVVTSILTYGIAIWASALKLQECQRMIYPVGRQMALRVTSAFRTVSRDAAHVISGILPIEILAEEYRSFIPV
ncbi:uncharacterized protein LOC124371908 [Homalodisca vitripennis]|uniref:uncharacterized protein LOC124371908 n=1 Tax=Homalodisca vitripennis TaxID=197043 RepID=UPI001EEA310F|nr:uncharacterized protein LOC124371908 [Homalodisca vitripennis]